MTYEFRGKTLSEAISKAVAMPDRPTLSYKGSDSDSAKIRSGGNARLVINVRPGERYTVEWSARSADEDVYSIDIFTDVDLGSHREAFSSDGSWSFGTGDYEGEVTVVVEFLYAFSRTRYLDVSVG
jgi:hypothetical protein